MVGTMARSRRALEVTDVYCVLCALFVAGVFQVRSVRVVRRRTRPEVSTSRESRELTSEERGSRLTHGR